MVRNVSPLVPGMSAEDLKLYLLADGRPAHCAERLMAAHGIDEAAGSGEIIPIDTCWKLFSEHAAQVGDEMHHVTQSSLKPGTTELLVARMLLCGTVLDAMLAYRDAACVLKPDLEIQISRRSDEVSVRWRFRHARTPLHGLATESTVVVYHAILCWIAGRILEVQRVKAPASRRSSSSTLMNSFSAPVVHEGDWAELTFAEAEFVTPVRTRDVKYWREGVFTILGQLVLNAASAGTASGAFTRSVRAELLKGSGQKEIAAKWGMSTKTIARRLAQEGSSFRQLRDEFRMNKAVSLIHGEVSVEEVAYMVGYEDARSFRRAFARWFGSSPSHYRDAQILA
jgi:AraC-like DNA-binding protein